MDMISSLKNLYINLSFSQATSIVIAIVLFSFFTMKNIFKFARKKNSFLGNIINKESDEEIAHKLFEEKIDTLSITLNTVLTTHNEITDEVMDRFKFLKFELEKIVTELNKQKSDVIFFQKDIENVNANTKETIDDLQDANKLQHDLLKEQISKIQDSIQTINNNLIKTDEFVRNISVEFKKNHSDLNVQLNSISRDIIKMGANVEFISTTTNAIKLR